MLSSLSSTISTVLTNLTSPIPRGPGGQPMCARGRRHAGTLVVIPYRKGNSPSLEGRVKYFGWAQATPSDLGKTLLIWLNYRAISQWLSECRNVGPKPA